MKSIYTLTKYGALVLIGLIAIVTVGVVMGNLIVPADMRWLNKDDITAVVCAGVFIGGLLVCLIYLITVLESE